jgi:hypothetical protein
LPKYVAPGTPTCGPFGENEAYTQSDGSTVDGTRAPFSNSIGTDAYYENMGNANYNALELTWKRNAGPLTMQASYTFGKSLDQSSSIQEQVDPYDFRKTYAISAFDIKHNFVASYNYHLPFERLFRAADRWTQGWSVSGIIRFATGLPVTFASFGDNYLVQVQNNGVNSISMDLPNYTPGNLKINNKPRNGLPYFNTALFTPNALGTPGTSSRRFFYGPGINNFDWALLKDLHLAESKTLEFRMESFNTFNHAQFYGANGVGGNVNSQTFGSVVSAAAPRILQIAAKFYF